MYHAPPLSPPAILHRWTTPGMIPAPGGDPSAWWCSGSKSVAIRLIELLPMARALRSARRISIRLKLFVRYSRLLSRTGILAFWIARAIPAAVRLFSAKTLSSMIGRFRLYSFDSTQLADDLRAQPASPPGRNSAASRGAILAIQEFPPGEVFRRQPQDPFYRRVSAA